MDVVYAMENVEKGRNDRPKEAVTIVKSGEVSHQDGPRFNRWADQSSSQLITRLMTLATRYLFVLNSRPRPYPYKRLLKSYARPPFPFPVTLNEKKHNLKHALSSDSPFFRRHYSLITLETIYQPHLPSKRR